MNKIIPSRYVFVTMLIVMAAVSRLLPHLPNFTPVAAIALFGGACYTNKKLAYAIPLLIMILSDLAMEVIDGTGFHVTILYVYVAFVLITTIGAFGVKKPGIRSIATASLLSSVLFFIITNFGVWAAYPTAPGMDGLIQTYVLGIPFFRYTLLGDLSYNTLLFGLLYLARIKFPQLAKA